MKVQSRARVEVFGPVCPWGYVSRRCHKPRNGAVCRVTRCGKSDGERRRACRRIRWALDKGLSNPVCDIRPRRAQEARRAVDLGLAAEINRCRPGACPGAVRAKERDSFVVVARDDRLDGRPGKTVSREGGLVWRGRRVVAARHEDDDEFVRRGPRRCAVRRGVRRCGELRCILVCKGNRHALGNDEFAPVVLLLRADLFFVVRRRYDKNVRVLRNILPWIDGDVVDRRVLPLLCGGIVDKI